MRDKTDFIVIVNDCLYPVFVYLDLVLYIFCHWNILILSDYCLEQ